MRLREKGANKSAVWATGAQPRQGIPGAGVACISVVAHGASQSSTSHGWRAHPSPWETDKASDKRT